MNIGIDKTMGTNLIPQNTTLPDQVNRCKNKMEIKLDRLFPQLNFPFILHAFFMQKMIAIYSYFVHCHCRNDLEKTIRRPLKDRLQPS